MPQARTPSRVGDETEEQLIHTALEAISHSHWVVGECAAKWTARYARGRTDADFAALIGLSADQVYQRRRVWESYGASRVDFTSLKWSHFYAALTWDDARDCLGWAEEMKASVAEMRAWRRAQRGEDLTVEALEEEAVRYLPTEPSFVQDPSHFAASGAPGGARGAGASMSAERDALAGVARQAGIDDGDYSPFRSDAGSPAPAGGHRERSGEPAAPPSPEQLVKRLTGTLERCTSILTADFRKDFSRLPEPVRTKFFAAAAELAKRVAGLR
jgi:hypothetical protein